MTIQNSANQRQSARESVVQLDHVGHAHVRKGGFHLLAGDPVVADHEGDVFEIQFVIAAHHLGEDEIEGVGAEELQPTSFRSHHRHNVSFPIRSEKNLMLGENVRDVETFTFVPIIHRIPRRPEALVVFERGQLNLTDDDIDVLRGSDFTGNSIKPKRQ